MKPTDGSWVSARPLGQHRLPTPGVEFGDMPAQTRLVGVLSVKRSSLTATTRYSVNGISIDPTSIQVVP